MLAAQAERTAGRGQAMAQQQVKWGIVSTIKAGAEDILRFAAHHLEMGAHRLYLYLDAPCPDAFGHLKAHPKIRVITCDDTYWGKQGRTKGRRPAKHQVRQSANATRAYHRQAAADVDWLLHCDVDEFLWSPAPVAATLAELPTEALCARVRPLEALAGGDGSAFKTLADETASAAAYGPFGADLRGGFLSHTQGKLFVRCGQPRLEFRIHNAFVDDTPNPGQAELAQMELCHFHARDWDSWLAHYQYRLRKGSYRAELKPTRARQAGGITMHELLSTLEREEGTAGLRRFFEAVCADSPALRERLDAAGLLRIRQLGLGATRQKHFPSSP